jgi:hypothetical protein
MAPAANNRPKQHLQQQQQTHTIITLTAVTLVARR